VIYGKSQVASKSKYHNTRPISVTSLMQRDRIATPQRKKLLYPIASRGGPQVCGLHEEVHPAGDVTEE
jgi:hypothetical protein